jgi:hypothetical protein
MEKDPVNSNSNNAFDPVVLFKVGDETFQMVCDYNVCKAIARVTGIKPSGCKVAGHGLA